MPSFDFSEQALSALRRSVRDGLTEYRFRHIAEVERMIARLGALYLPSDLPRLRAAALLHDFTKELSAEEHEKILRSHGILLTDEDRLSPKLYHAVTAALTIPEAYPHLADDEIVRAVRYHTTGRAGITVFEMLLYLADYIDESRTFESCVQLRNAFWDAEPHRMDEEARMKHLLRVLVQSVDRTVSALVAEGSPISADSIEMRNDLLCRLARL